MYEKLTVEDLIIRIIPGSFLLMVIYFLELKNLSFTLSDNLDFLYSLVFLSSSFILGELLQTIAHETEWIVNIFFKCRKPSEAFLYKNNPVLKNNYMLSRIFEAIDINKKDLQIFNKDFSNLSFCGKGEQQERSLSQDIFWKLYNKVSSTEEVKNANRNYLFCRVMIIDFMTISLLFVIYDYKLFAILGFVALLIFLWRSRGIARGLVFKTVSLNLVEQK